MKKVYLMAATIAMILLLFISCSVPYEGADLVDDNNPTQEREKETKEEKKAASDNENIAKNDKNITTERGTQGEKSSERRENTKDSSVEKPSSKPSETEKTEEEKTSGEADKEKTVLVKYPVYGPVYTYYWIKNDEGKIIFETVNADEYNAKLAEYGEEGETVSYGSDGRQDISGYKEVRLKENEYYESDFSKRTDVTIVWE